MTLFDSVWYILNYVCAEWQMICDGNALFRQMKMNQYYYYTSIHRLCMVTMWGGNMLVMTLLCLGEVTSIPILIPPSIPFPSAYTCSLPFPLCSVFPTFCSRCHSLLMSYCPGVTVKSSWIGIGVTYWLWEAVCDLPSQSFKWRHVVWWWAWDLVVCPLLSDKNLQLWRENVTFLCPLRAWQPQAE